MSDIVDRLRAVVKRAWSWDYCYPGNLNIESLIVDLRKEAGEAANEIERLRSRSETLEAALRDARDLLLERVQGSPARSAAHNARLVIDAALSPAPSEVVPVWRHKKRGTTYTIVGKARLQSERAVFEGCGLTVYRCRETGVLCARPVAEFEDGRFEKLAPALSEGGDGWQDIASAPRDGTPIQIWQEGLEPNQYVAAFDDRWSNGGWWVICDGKNTEIPLRGSAPTHWRNVFAAPTAPETT